MHQRLSFLSGCSYFALENRRTIIAVDKIAVEMKNPGCNTVNQAYLVAIE